MIYYISLYSLAILGIFDRYSRTIAAISTAFVFIFSFILLGMRSEDVGIDTSAYHGIFNSLETRRDPFVSEYLEPIYVWLNRLIISLGGNADHLIALTGLVVVLSITIFFFKYSPSAMLSWAILLGYGTFFSYHNVMRQSVALAILLFTLPLILNRRFILFCIFIVIAMGFHYSAIVFFLMYYLYNARPGVNVLILAWLISILFVLKSSLFFNLLSFFSFLIPGQYAGYLSNPDIVTFGGQGIGLRLIFIQFLFFFILYYYQSLVRIERQEENSYKSRYFLLIAIISIILTNLFHHVGIISRLLHYFIVFLPIAIPLAINGLFKGYIRLTFIMSFVILFFVLYIRVILKDPYEIFPYATFL
jgi:hypothetical protein